MFKISFPRSVGFYQFMPEIPYREKIHQLFEFFIVNKSVRSDRYFGRPRGNTQGTCPLWTFINFNGFFPEKLKKYIKYWRLPRWLAPLPGNTGSATKI